MRKLLFLDSFRLRGNHSRFYTVFFVNNWNSLQDVSWFYYMSSRANICPIGDREALECYVARGRYLFDRQSSHDVIEIYRFHHKVSCIQKYIHLIISTQWFSSWLLRMSRKLIYNLLTSLSTISAKCRRPSLHYIITTYRVLYC